MTATQPFATTYDEAWQQFTSRATTQDESAYDATQRANTAKSAYVAFLIPVTSHAIVEATRPVREALTAAGIDDVIPSHYFHITVLGIGLESAIRTTTGNIARIMDRTSRALRDVQPLMLNVRGVNSFGNAAFAEVQDQSNGLASLRDTLVRSIHQIGLPGFGESALSTESPASQGEAPQDRADKVNAPPYLPHLSLCYYHTQYPTKQVADILAPYRELELGRLRLNYVTLASIPHSDFDRFPPITRIADLLIG